MDPANTSTGKYDVVVYSPSYTRSGRSANTRITMVKIRVIATMVRIGRGLMEFVILNNILSEAYIP